MAHIGCLIIVYVFSLMVGFGYFIEGETTYGIFWSLLPIFYTVYVVYKWPEWKREEALHKMYDYPYSISWEYGEQWEREFQRILSKGIDVANDSEKKIDLRHCQNVVKKIKDDAGFYYLQHTFRLTGCHISVTDSNGKQLANIV